MNSQPFPWWKFQIKRWKHYLSAYSEYNLHSPFVFNFYTKVVPKIPVFNWLFSGKVSQEKIVQTVIFKAFEYFEPKNFLKSGNLWNVQWQNYISSKGIPSQFINSSDKTFSLSENFGQTVEFALFDAEALENGMAELFIKHHGNRSVFVIEGIHQSKQAEQAWKKIQTETAVTASIDLFFVGFLFFKKELSKQDFVLRF